MAFLVAAVILAGAIGLVNLMFTYGVVRRLREHTEILDRLAGPSGKIIIEPGQRVADVAAVTVDGDSIAIYGSDGPTLVGFFAPACQPCKAKLPGFVELARQHPGGRRRVLAVMVGGSDDEAEPFMADLGDAASVVRDGKDGPVPVAFGVQGFPAFALIGADGEVKASGSDLSALSSA